jgi:hypothetical protein
MKGGGFAPAVALDAGTAIPYALVVADLNRDGHPDVLVGYVHATSAAFFGDGRRQFARVDFGDTRGAVYGFAIADLDGDGNVDIVAARSEAPSMVYFGDANGRRQTRKRAPGAP